ncbi:MAG: UBP-type zinc finger domain-containing protein [Deltaproteobacteria bacterium]|nr:UBP-type zinc finger domain-containing protein [Deltaproteobacteria bacterium]
MPDPQAPCRHLAAVLHRDHGVTPSALGCVDCLAIGARWVHLRLCLTCGHVGCCDSSPNRHASKHARARSHPVIRSFEPGEAWAYCYPDDASLDELAAFAGEAPPVHYHAP